jgi:hypothetical protein
MAAARAGLEPALARALLDLLELCISTVRQAVDYPAAAPPYDVLLTPARAHVRLPAPARRGGGSKQLLRGEKVTPVGVDRDLIALVPCANVGPIGEGPGRRRRRGRDRKGSRCS